MTYRDLQASGMAELDSLRLSREQRTARKLDAVAAFVAERFPDLAECPYAVMAAIRCKEQGLPAACIPDARRQLLERAA